MTERPKITQMVIDIFSKVLDDQDLKGIEKYNETIDEAKDENYHWLEMAGEEVADCFKYFVKEIVRLKKVIYTLKYSQRKTLVDKLLKENLELAQEVERLKIVEDAYAAYKSANA